MSEQRDKEKKEKNRKIRLGKSDNRKNKAVPVVDVDIFKIGCVLLPIIISGILDLMILEWLLIG